MSSRKRTLDISSAAPSSTIAQSKSDKKHKQSKGSDASKRATPLIDKIFDAETSLLNGKQFSKKYYDILEQRRRLPVYDFLDESDLFVFL